MIKALCRYLRTMRENPCRRGHTWSEAPGYGYLCEVCGASQRGY